MTHDTNNYNDPYKINITVESSTDGYCEFFEKGLSALLADDHFLLLYVPEDGAKMRIIRPASDPYHKKRMIKKINEAKEIPSFYYALSHLWGLSDKNRHLWNDIGQYVDDQEGQPAAPVPMRPEKRNTLLSMLKDHPDSYWWIDVLCARTDTPLDIMGDIYACCLGCIAMIDCAPSLIHSIADLTKEINELYCIKESRDLTQEEISKINYPHILNYLSTFMQSQWWKRVWTWQELILPLGDVHFMSEIGTHRPPLINTIHVDDLRRLNSVLIYISHRQGHERGSWEAMGYEFDKARITSHLRLYGDPYLVFYNVIRSLSESPRQCMDPVDYVYGVLGMLQIKIPRMKDTNAVWQRFLTELDNCLELEDGHQFIDYAQGFDLRKAKTIGDVYRKLLYIEHSWENDNVKQD
ncbi:hypothetical protein LRAMOSA09100 [Lichtheimia ramosa]|uniref:Heterokaryon incompatibility domain-containing protein n=1 Tax=Lichtheimia ramosa TaxID=688394 RepID=A0A077WIZ7_9FUNG|nr:hypothetical protein LRAMOSA09100 [Lichtheimia ramosa]